MIKQLQTRAGFKSRGGNGRRANGQGKSSKQGDLREGSAVTGGLQTSAVSS